MPERPNVVFLFADDQRFDTIAALNNDRIATPNLDALVADGVAFDNACIMGGSSPAVCMPSRAMLHSGRGLWEIAGQGQQIPLDHATLGETFRKAGYTTFATGKWHNGTESFNRSFSHGGAIFFGGMSDHWNVPLHEYDPTGQYTGEHSQVLSGRHSTDLLSEAACGFLDEMGSADDPFLMYVSYLAPHDPRETHKRYHDLYAPASIELPGNFMPQHPFNNGEMVIRDELLAGFPRSERDVQRHIGEYYAMITHVDESIGQVVAKLKETGQYDNTVIVFAGDNGLAVGRHGLMGKQSCYDHSVHVPLIFAGPGLPKGQRRSQLAYLHDIFPTLCDLAGVDTPPSVTSRSLAGPLAGESAEGRSELLFAYRHLHRAATDGRFKLIENVVLGWRTTQLFDLQADPLERNNLAAEAEYAAPLAELRQSLQQWRDEWGDTQEMGQAFWGGYDLWPHRA